MTRAAVILALLALVVSGAAGSSSHPSVVGPAVAQAVARHGSAKVMIVFRASPAMRTLASTVSTVRAVRSRILERARDGFRATARWDAVMAVPGRITTQGLSRLASDPDVRRIGLDGDGGHAADAESGPLIHADQAQALGYTGEGVTVAIVDGGIDRTHPDLQASLVGEHCINDCPNGPGNAQDQFGHGTNVSGIVASKGTIAPIGIAPGAKLVAVKMLDRRDDFQSSDQIISALNWIATKRPDVKVVNMSIDTSALFSGYCDNATASTMAISSAVRTLYSRGVTLFASTGNDRSTASMAAPACIRHVIAVGAVYDSAYGSGQFFCDDPSVADKVTCFSDSSPALDLLAPGAAITSTGLRSLGSPTSTYYGTSQASPHAAAAAAILLQARPSLTPAQIESTLKSTGKSVSDWRNGRVTPRIDVLAALNAVLGSNPPPPPPPKLKVTKFVHSPKHPAAGKPYRVQLGVARKDTGKKITQGRVTCEASIAKRREVVVLQAFRAGLATCVWNIPRSAAGKTMKGSIAVTTQEGATARRLFGFGVGR